jgi:hypothetical protein
LFGSGGWSFNRTFAGKADLGFNGPCGMIGVRINLTPEKKKLKRR